jgi:hypothetical protein
MIVPLLAALPLMPLAICADKLSSPYQLETKSVII